MNNDNEKPDTGVPLKRLVSPCRCRYQAETPWGYHLWKWIGGRKSWKAIGYHKNLDVVAKYADDKGLDVVLIACRGCGADVLREQRANHTIIRHLSDNNKSHEKPTP